MLKKNLKKIPFFRDWIGMLNNLNERTEWVKKQLDNLAAGASLLDAGCGSQQYRIYCEHLSYKGQDFGLYVSDEKKMLGSEIDSCGATANYEYGKLDYTSDIWDIPEKDESFDAILCTEVLEHIPYPIETLNEFSRLLKPGGTLILTAPFACLRHMDPFFFYTGFSDRWYEKFLADCGLEIKEITPVGDYYSWIGVEVARTFLSHGFWAKLILFPAFIYFFSKKKTQISSDTLCGGYHVRATKV